jgi:hypothetical protein
MTDLAPAVFGLIGAGVGGIGSAGIGAFVERGKFKRERAAIAENERRAFRIDTLTKIDAAFEELFKTALSLVLLHSAEPSQERLDLMRRVGEAQTQVSALAARIHDERLRQLCSEASGAVSKASLDLHSSQQVWNEATYSRAKALEAIGVAQRELFA